MIPKPRTRMGVRYRLAESGPSRFSKGKRHLQYWSKGHKEWKTYCTDKWWNLHSDVFTPDLEVCSKCGPMIESVFL